MDEKEIISMRKSRVCQSCDIGASAQFMSESHGVIDERVMRYRRCAKMITN